MCVLVSSSNGKKSKTASAPNIEGGLQLANAVDVWCFKCGGTGHNVKTCAKMTERPKWWIEKN